MALIPNEEYMARKETIHKERKGILALTNFRLIWTHESSSIPEVILSYVHIGSIEKVSSSQRSIIRLSRKDFQSNNLAFVFFSDTHAEDMMNFYGQIESFQKRPQKPDEYYYLSKDSQKKVKILESNKELAMIHKNLVRTGKMNQEDFWKLCDDYKEYMKKQVYSNQVAGKLSSIVRIPHRFITSSRVEVKLLKRHKELIFRQLPYEQKNFNCMVPHKKNEIEFWRSFWENQLKIGNPMSDALEIIGLKVNQVLDLESSEDISPHFGLYKPKGPRDERMKKNKQVGFFNEISLHINSHSSYVIADALPAPKKVRKNFKSFNNGDSEDMKMKIDGKNNENIQWGKNVVEWFQTAKPEQVFIKHAEAFESIRQIVKQINIKKSKEVDKSDDSQKYVSRVYQVLKFFYHDIKFQSESFEKLNLYLELCKDLHEEMRMNCKNLECLDLMENVILRAYEFFQMINSG
jgi:hypothetical protein